MWLMKMQCRAHIQVVCCLVVAGPGDETLPRIKRSGWWQLHWDRSGQDRLLSYVIMVLPP